MIAVPDPILRPGGILYETKNSLVSVGTEKLMIDLAKKGYIGKALARPDLVKQVINKIKVDGLADAYQAVMSRLDAPVTLGYSSVGVVKEIGENVPGLKIGDRVASFGDGFATHSEMSFLPKNMLAKIPTEVSFEDAAFVGLGAIALNAIRVANLTFGEKVAVIGLGLLGQLSVQMLKAFGCRVVGIDISGAKAELAGQLGCDRTAVIGKDDAKSVVHDFTQGVGADAVIIMAGSRDNAPIELAAEISRDKGRIVACGMINLDVPRQEFFKKELSVIVSRATGPGKFDPLYENRGIDYPLPYVRWTTQRNLEYFLDLIAAGQLNVERLISHRFGFDQALQAYEMILKGSEPYLGVLLEYTSAERERESKIILKESPSVKTADTEVKFGLIGAGLHSNTSILPVIKNLKNARLIGVADAEGFKGRHAGKKFGFEYCVSDYKELLRDNNINAVLIATRHNLHAEMTIASLKAGKHVFVEKPLALKTEELEEIERVYHSSDRQLMVGFNRRYAPLSRQAKELLGSAENLVINCRVNAGTVPAQSWVQDAAEGGGRIIGEVCHFVDLIQYLSGALVIRVFAESTGEKGEDNLAVNLRLNNGSIATILYVSQGDRLLPRERIEIFSGSAVCVIDNFKSLFYAKNGKGRKIGNWGVDRGYAQEFEAWTASLKTGIPPVDIKDNINTTLTTFAIMESINSGKPVEIKGEEMIG